MVKEQARKTMITPKTDQISRDARPTLCPVFKSGIKESTGS